MNQPTPMPSLLANRYRVLRVLGDGGFGTTYLAEDSQMPSQRKCVVKQLKPVEENPEIYQLVKDRFQREAAILETLGDGFDQIPHLYAYFSEGEQFYLVEEWVEGQTLTQKVHREGILPESIIRNILVQTLPVLGYIHQKRMVHRDIKPDNIIIRQLDQKPVLIDFGAVKETMSTVVNSQGDSSRSIVVGTPGFMPSEQMAGRPLFSSDLYSLGLTAIFMLTGKIPQDLESDPVTGQLNWQQFAPAVTPGFAALINRSIQMNPSDRFPSADQMLAGLQSFEAATVSANSGGVEPTEVNIPTPPPPQARQSNYPQGSQPQYPQSPQYSQPQYQQAPVPPQTYQQPSYPQAAQNIVPQSSQPTVQVPGLSQPLSSNPVIPQSVSPQRASGDWKKAGLIGGLIGLSILGGAMMLQAQIGDFINSVRSPNTEQVGSDPVDSSDNAQSSTETTPNNPPPEPVQPPSNPPPQENWDTDAKIIGAAGKKNIRSGPGTNFAVKHIAYPGDRVQVLDEDYDQENFLWYLIYFPKSNAEGWIAGHLLKIDGQPAYQPPKPDPTPTPKPDPTPDPKPDPTPTPEKNSNATIVGDAGSKNIRSGPGTNFKVAHIAYPGDRIKVVGSDYDSGGYRWYQVYFPKSGAQGWIAAQLVKLD